MPSHPLRLSFSTQRMLHVCARKYFLYTQFKKPSFRPGSELGKAFHKLLELSTGNPVEIVPAYEAWCAEQLKYLLEAGILKADESQKLTEIQDKGVALWQGYCDAIYAKQLKPRIVKMLATEYRFLLQTENDVSIPGVIDFIALIENPWYGSDDEKALCPTEELLLVIGDYKTSGLPVQLFTEALMQSHQPGIYLAWAQSREFETEFPEVFSTYGYPVGFLYDLVVTPDIRQKVGKKTAETREEFLNRYRLEVSAEEQLEDGSMRSQRLRRFLFTPSEASIKDTLLCFQLDGKLMEIYRQAGTFPKAGNPSACIAYSQMCEYAAECSRMTEGTLPEAPRLIQIQTDNRGVEEDEDSEQF